MSEKHPSISQWRNLYNAAIEFRKLAPWEWMYDSDLFGVINPENGETGYCCIMGNLGEHYALGVYLGAEGLEGYREMQEGDYFSNPLEMIHLQKCLMASFENREYLSKVRDLYRGFVGDGEMRLVDTARPVDEVEAEVQSLVENLMSVDL